jgi:hypothetical protein
MLKNMAYTDRVNVYLNIIISAGATIVVSHRREWHCGGLEMAMTTEPGTLMDSGFPSVCDSSYAFPNGIPALRIPEWSNVIAFFALKSDDDLMIRS